MVGVFCSALLLSMSLSSAATFLRLCALVSPAVLPRSCALCLATCATRFCERSRRAGKHEASTAQSQDQKKGRDCDDHQRLTPDRVERVGQFALQIVVAGAFPEGRAHDAGADMLALQAAGLVLAL